MPYDDHNNLNDRDNWSGWNDLTDLDEDTILSSGPFQRNRDEAERLLNDGDPDQIEALLRKLEEKLKGVPKVGDKLAHIPVLVSLIRSYVRKEYTQLPVASAVGILAALLYFLSPVDLIPDAIPVIGLLDDAAVVAFVWKLVEADVESYLEWRDGKTV